MSIGEAANAIGISADTLRRWDRAGQVQSYRTDRGFRRIPVWKSPGSRAAHYGTARKPTSPLGTDSTASSAPSKSTASWHESRSKQARSWSPLPSHATRSRTSASHPDLTLRRSEGHRRDDRARRQPPPPHGPYPTALADRHRAKSSRERPSRSDRPLATPNAVTCGRPRSIGIGLVVAASGSQGQDFCNARRCQQPEAKSPQSRKGRSRKSAVDLND